MIGAYVGAALSASIPLAPCHLAFSPNGLLFVSGIVPVDADGRVIGGEDVVEQARQVFRNMGDRLQPYYCKMLTALPA